MRVWCYRLVRSTIRGCDRLQPLATPTSNTWRKSVAKQAGANISLTGGTPTEGAQRRREERSNNWNRGTPTEGAQRRREEQSPLGYRNAVTGALFPKSCTVRGSLFFTAPGRSDFTR